MKAALAERLEESINAGENGQADGGAQAPDIHGAQAPETADVPAAAANGELVRLQGPFPSDRACNTHC